MATLQQLKTYYSHVTRIPYGLISGVDATTLNALASQVDSGSTSFANAAVQVEKLAIGSVSVAVLDYQFFTGATPLLGGLDFLTKPDGPNPNNLNSGYYSTFDVGNRYINLAVSLGANGEGKPAFTAAYGSGTLEDAATKAYTAIFSFAPAAGKIQQILSDPAPNGKGGTYTRADYFAELGGSTRDGLGAKAAVVGYFLGEAVKADLGPYATALDSFLADLGPDGIASNHVNLLDVYGPALAATPGATIAFNHDQSVSSDASTPALRSTAGDDVITGSNGLDAPQTVQAGTGADTITISGTAAGLVDGGAGNDRVTVDVLPAATALVGGAPNGVIRLGDGNDTVTVTTRMAAGATIDGGAGDDTAVVAFNETTFPMSPFTFTGVEHLVITQAQETVTLTTGTESRSLVVGVPSDILDVTTRASHDLTLSGLTSAQVVRLQGAATGGIVTLAYQTTTTIVASGPGGFVTKTTGQPSSDIHLDGTGSTPANPSVLVATGLDGPLTISVDSDSSLGSISNGSYTSPSSLMITGLGKLTSGVGQYITKIDATAAAAVDLSQGPASTATVLLSSGDDRFAANLYFANSSVVTLGAGADTLAVAQDAVRASLPQFANMTVTNGQVTGFLTVTDFTKGADQVVLASAAPTYTSGLSGFVGAATTLDQALANVSSHLAANGTGVFEFAGDTYIYHQDATVGANTGDGLIRLVGVTGLSVAAGAASGDIHYG